MHNIFVRYILWVVAYVSSVAILALPIFAALKLHKGRICLVVLFFCMFYLVRKLLFVIEDKLDIRSYQNPNSREKGAGITIIAPWLRKKMERMAEEVPQAKDGNG